VKTSRKIVGGTGFTVACSQDYLGLEQDSFQCSILHSTIFCGGQAMSYAPPVVDSSAMKISIHFSQLRQQLCGWYGCLSYSTRMATLR